VKPEDLEKVAKANVDLEDRDLRDVLSTPGGRRVMWRIIHRYGGLQELSFDRDDRNTNLHEGRRALAISLNQECQRVAPVHHVQMVTEALQRQQQERLLAEATRDE
jgi:hypothetical protein